MHFVNTLCIYISLFLRTDLYASCIVFAMHTWKRVSEHLNMHQRVVLTIS